MHPNLTSFDFNFLLPLFLPIAIAIQFFKEAYNCLILKKLVTLGPISLIELEECHFLHQDAVPVYSAELIHEQRNLAVNSINSSKPRVCEDCDR